MKEKNNEIMNDIIKKGEGYALFLALVTIDGTVVPKIVFASCDEKRGILYHDFRTKRFLSASDINQINQFTHSTSKKTEEAITLDVFFSHAKKEVGIDPNIKEIEINAYTKEINIDYEEGGDYGKHYIK